MKKIIFACLCFGLVGCGVKLNYTPQQLQKTGKVLKICSNKSPNYTYKILLKNISECYSYTKTGTGYGGYGAYTYKYEMFYKADKANRSIVLGTIGGMGKRYTRSFRVISGKGKCKSVVISTISTHYKDFWDKKIKLWLKGKRDECPGNPFTNIK